MKKVQIWFQKQQSKEYSSLTYIYRRISLIAVTQKYSALREQYEILKNSGRFYV